MEESRRPLAVLHPKIRAEEVAGLKSELIRGVLPLIPDQKLLLRHEEWRVVDPYDCYSLRFHQRVLVRQRKFRLWLEKRLEEAGLTEAGKANLITSSLQASATMWRLYTLLRAKGPWLIFAGGKWSESHDLLHVCTWLYPLLSPPAAGNPYVEIEEKSAPRWIKAFLEWRRARLLRKKKVVVISSLAQGFVPLSQSFLTQAPDTWLLQSPLKKVSRSCRPDIDALLAPPREKIEWGDRHSRLDFQGDERIFHRVRQEVRSVLREIDDEFLKAAFDVHASGLSEEIAHGESIVPALAKTLREAGIKQVLLYDICQQERLWLAEGARKAGVERWQFAHMAVADYAKTATLWEAYRRRATMIAASPMASHVFAQSPSALGIIERIRPSAVVRKVRPIIWCPEKDVPRRKPDAAVRTIVFAGNYDAWSGYQPIINETCDDYVAGMISLARAVAKLPDTKLLIRFKCNFKSKSEIDPANLPNLLPPDVNWELRGEKAFYDDLAESDLLVSFSSTVIEEAIHYGYPVLLWGGHMPYTLLPAQEEPPVPGKTSAVYACRQSADLPHMLDGILNCHANRPLTKEEQAPYVWGKIPGRARLIKEILGEVK